MLLVDSCIIRGPVPTFGSVASAALYDKQFGCEDTDITQRDVGGTANTREAQMLLNYG